MALKRALHATPLERRFGLPEYVGGITSDEVRERAAEARWGGRYITGRIAQLLGDQQHYWPDFRVALSGGGLVTRETGEPAKGMPGSESPAAALAHVWRTHLSPEGSGKGSGREATASAARAAAAEGFRARPRSLLLREAEAMAGWPIFAAAHKGYWR